MPPFDIRERTFEFACAIVKFHSYLLQETSTPRRVAEQLLAAGTSIGANVEEAEAAHSKADFAVKNSNALKEARESRYWLRILRACELVPSTRVDPYIQESQELISIITAIRRNSGHRSDE
jgi:four helix bundle protein